MKILTQRINVQGAFILLTKTFRFDWQGDSLLWQGLGDFAFWRQDFRWAFCLDCDTSGLKPLIANTKKLYWNYINTAINFF